MYKKYSQELIQELIRTINLPDYIGQYIELRKNNNIYMGICPFHTDTDASLAIYPETNSFYCFGCQKTGTIIQFVMEYHKIKFPEAVELLIKYSNLDVNSIKTELESVKFIKQFHKKHKEKEEVKHTILTPDIMNQYQNVVIKEWLNEGIHPDIMKKYNIRYDEKSNRAVFPIYDTNSNFINIKGRTLYPNYKDLGIKKYIYYYPLGCNDFLYGLNGKQDNISLCNSVILVEGEKSVWKLEGWNINNALALCTSHVNDFQLKLLLELKCDITIALDKGISMNDIKVGFNTLSKFTNVYVMYDTDGLLNDKDSPCDKGLEIWNQLYENKIKI